MSDELKYWPTVKKGQSGGEGQLQETVARFLDLHKHFWQHTPNEGKRSPQLGAKLKRQGLKPGMPDVIVYDLRLAVELKAGNNKPTEAQRARLKEFRAIGWVAYWVNTFDEFRALYNTLK